MKETLVVGKITSPHGIIGEVKVYPLTDDPERFLLLKSVFIDGVDYTIEKVRRHKEMIILKIDGINDRNKAETFKNAYIEIVREDAVPLKKGQYFIVDLIGLKVYENNHQIGLLKDIISSASTDIYVITLNEDKEIMVPAIKEYILDIDITNKKIIVSIPEGLKEL